MVNNSINRYKYNDGVSVPKYSAAELYRLFSTPGRMPERARREQKLADQGERLDDEVWGSKIVGHRWTSPVDSDRTVLVQHGWGNRATFLWPIINRLLESGWNVIGFDAPGNGDSDGETSTMFHFAETLRTIGEKWGPFDAVVSHSIGASATPLAISQGFSVSRAVLISARNDLPHFLTRFLELMEQPAEMYHPVLEQWDAALGWQRVLDAQPSVLASNFELPALLIHDQQDLDVPFQDSVLLHQSWPNSELLLTENLGHLMILRNETVMDRIVRFLSAN